MIFDDLKNVTRYKGIHPNLDKAIDYLYQYRKDTFELGKYEIDGDKVFLVVQENVLNQEDSDQFEYHKNYADFHLLTEGHEFCSYGARVLDEAVAFDDNADIGFVHCQDCYPLLLGHHNFAIFFPREPHQPNSYAGLEEKVRKYLFKILID
ncbi:putative sugar isomerase involved in processing of exogenous sialic acid [Streptococcus sp. DD10]|uniref:YhcH/YjgK/YiaL family protein n=1 Tax=Streptococcus sp. DD10 TaxID=1777878 RepID=UPI0007953D74|nr:YhcH/YjgK/YiaL family protein [Streptococcus sp. DD10]KXT73058.1 putative sugar isomerase involved in processing of exogenous sialic acid [Streptococcus sp. DD10]